MPRGDTAPGASAESDCTGAPPPATPLTADQFLWLAGSLCQLHRVPFDAALLAQRHVPPYTAAQLQEALRELGIAVRSAGGRELDGPTAETVGHVAFAVAWLRPTDGPSAAQPVLVVRATAAAVVYFAALAEQPQTLPRPQFRARLAGPVLLATRQVEEPGDPDAVQQRPRFGFRWFVPELLKHKRIWRDVLAASAAIQLLALGMPLMTQAIIDKVVVHRTESTLIALGVGLAIFLVFSSVFTWIRQRLILATGVRIDAVLSSAVFRHLVALPPRYFQQRPTGVIAARLHGIESIRDFLASAAIALILDLPFLSICLAIMFSYSVLLTVIALGILALIVAASLAVAPVFQAKLNREFLLGARNQAFVTEYVAGMDTVKSLQMEPILTRRFGDYQAAYLQAGFETKQVANTYNVVATTLEQAMGLLILVFGAWIVMTPPAAPEAVFTVGMLVAFQMFASKLSQPIMRLVGLWQQFQQARLAVTRLGDLMDAPTEPYSLVPARSTMLPSPLAGEGPGERGKALIEIQHLAFRHAEDRPFLYEDLNLAIRAGECVAIMGPSGCGKSTLARLLQGFYQPTRGAILIAGIDARYLAANELRATFGVVPQETVLFSGTVLDNLLLANPQASFEEVVAACRMAEIHAVIERLPQGYQTEIGERGAGLSGGQRQRIAIARALLKRPKVLIFDEATANLDAETAASFARTIDALRGQVTILFITHAPIGTLKFDRMIRLGAPQ
jgi:subfamily B ATP-binding cassette protein HlyB/CyaB